MKTRIDQLLVARGLFDSRSQARAAIEAGLVLADGVIVRKASEQFADDIALEAQPA
ncbi:TlyA family rRNA (cytidine-2'-O)-methyltransferase, partial [Brevundimonas vesicularis]|nr:TlyA family rRNA (cytidine-2'-O)-methyltransferase [Brevundimonas vesicularis]